MSSEVYPALAVTAFSTGTWTPVCQGDFGGGPFTLTGVFADYQRTGQLVFFTVGFRITVVPGGAIGPLTISGLPFPPNREKLFAADVTNAIFGTNFVAVVQPQADGRIRFFSNSSGDPQVASLEGNQVTAPSDVYVTGFYLTDQA